MTTSTQIPSSARIQSVDILRGLIMVLMAIDHVRVYSGVPAGSLDTGIFFTRWITHFCAPGFTFFAGTAIFLFHSKNTSSQTTFFLLTRGLLLVGLEVTVIRFFWTFNFNYGNFFLAGVIWMLGWCMVLMALFVRLKPVVVGIIGLVIIFFQDAFSYVPGLFQADSSSLFTRLWQFIYPSGADGLSGISILYVIVPWIGVMAAGYGFGLILQMEPKKRDRLCYIIGFSCIAFFLVLGSLYVTRQPETPEAPPFIFRLLNQRKYPASPFYLLMTLGPLIALIPWAEKLKNALAAALTAIGRVPMFYYLLHILLIHLSAIAVMYFKFGTTGQQWYATAPFVFMEEGNRWSLGLLYLVFIINVTVLYFLCRWYSALKSKNDSVWLRYL